MSMATFTPATAIARVLRSSAVTIAAGALLLTKCQADMGIPLAFMFIWNMLGALLLLPALAHFLLPQGKQA